MADRRFAKGNKRHFSVAKWRADGAWKRGLRTLVYLQRPKRFRIESERSTQVLVPKNDCSRGGRIPFTAKRRPEAACSRSSQVFGIASAARPVELFLYRYTAGDGLLHHEIQRQ